ncbi:MAG TPA: hypothetical protein VFV07_05865 [Rhizomicrobium sp.]|nr:hypothetical protein [Rhizomicrobium sp.]
MARRSFLLIPILLLAGCVQHPIGPATAPLSPAAEVQEIADADAAQYEFAGMRAVEGKVLPLAARVVKRGAYDLTLTLEDGKTIDFADSPLCARENWEHDCVRYVLQAWLPSRHAFVVSEMKDEAGRYWLVDARSGAKLAIGGPPHFSPDGARFVTFDNDEENDADGIRIWVRKGAGYESEWNREQIADFVRWDGNDRILVTLSPPPDNDGKLGQGHAGALVRSASGWSVAPIR